tara:strand:+ start:352 stop:627 length:276 start_codon:yes stop_codon:yes gene_type:complete
MQATNKVEAIDKFLTLLNKGGRRQESVSNGKCVCCKASGLTETSFKDALSIKEYTISGMCQKCQDVAFAPQEDDDEPFADDDAEFVFNSGE